MSEEAATAIADAEQLIERLKQAKNEASKGEIQWVTTFSPGVRTEFFVNAEGVGIDTDRRFVAFNINDRHFVSCPGVAVRLAKSLLSAALSCPPLEKTTEADEPDLSCLK